MPRKFRRIKGDRLAALLANGPEPADATADEPADTTADPAADPAADADADQT
jgi:hypothetical protein